MKVLVMDGTAHSTFPNYMDEEDILENIDVKETNAKVYKVSNSLNPMGTSDVMPKVTDYGIEYNTISASSDQGRMTEEQIKKAAIKK